MNTGLILLNSSLLILNVCIALEKVKENPKSSLLNAFAAGVSFSALLYLSL